MEKFKKIFLVDNFDSFTFNLVDYFEQLGCEVSVFRNDVEVDVVERVGADLIVFSPGPSVPSKAGNMMKIIGEYVGRVPMFGVCLGHEGFIEHFGGSLKFIEPVHGKSSSISHDGKTIFSDLDSGFLAGRYHSLCADSVPACFEVSASCDGLVMGIRHKELPIESVQFHPESVLSMNRGQGFRIIQNIVSKQFANV
ncbi:MAG: aminodeoxychorismate/anthranilate synthase component II [Candidatus Peregrinibacteria bacterium]